jgi:hypothetical protein
METDRKTPSDSLVSLYRDKRKLATILTILILLSVIVCLTAIIVRERAAMPQPVPATTRNIPMQKASEPNSVTEDKGAATTTATDTTGIIDAKYYNTMEALLREYPSFTADEITFIKQLAGYGKTATDEQGESQAFLYAVPAQDSDMLYIASNDYGIQYAGVKVYSLNLKTGETATIYSDANPNVKSEVEYDLAGRQGNELLFFRKNLMDSPGPCSNAWVMAHDEKASAYDVKPAVLRAIQSLDLDNIKAGLKDYTVPEAKYKLEKPVYNKCVSDFEQQNRGEEQAASDAPQDSN